MDINSLRKKWQTIMKDMSETLSGNPSLGDIAATFALVREVEKTLDPKDKSGIAAVAKEKLVEAIKIDGTKTDGASTVFSVGGWRMMMHPTRSGLDPRKYEARLISKKKNVAQFMKPVISYVLDEKLVEKAIKMKVFTKEEIAEMQYDESWTLKTPTFEGE